MRDDRAAQAARDENTVLRLTQRATGGRLLVLRVVIVLVLLMAAQVYDGSLHALSHWFILGLYAAGSVWFGRAERGDGRHAEGFAWAGTALNAGLAIYVIIEHMLAGAADTGGGADAVSQLPAFLLLLQTALSMRVWHTALFAGTVAFAWGAAILAGLVDPDGFLGPHVDLAEQAPGLLTFLAAGVVVVDGIARLRHAAGEAVRLEHERAQLARFVPDGVAAELARDGDLGTARRRHACLLALDIRGFSRLSRNHPPETMVRALLAVRALAHTAVTEHNGIVDKYVGDAVLAEFVVGGPEAQARGALASARAIRTRLAALNRDRAATGDFPLRVVVALHAGDLLVGVFDDGLRAEYTVLGPAMNTLARLETRAKAADLDIAASEDFLRLLGLALLDGARAEPVAEEGDVHPALFAIAIADAA